MHIQFFGAAKTVTGSCHLVRTAKTTFLVDCGMFQGDKTLKENNYGAFGFEPRDIDFVLLTHAHIDHSGLLPKLYKHGYQGTTYTTRATKELCGVVLPDSGYIQENEVERKNRKLARSGVPLLEPIYTAEDAKRCLPYIEGKKYRETYQLSEDVKVRFQDAGHILGAAIIEIFVYENGKETKLVISGDIGNTNQAIIEDPTYIKEADYVVMESTYGNRYHIHSEDKVELLAQTVNEALARGGNILIPSFAVERTQDMVYILKSLKDEGKIPQADIYIDSPMAVAATKVFIENKEIFDDEATAKLCGKHAECLFNDAHIHYMTTSEESMSLNRIKRGAIILSASGMCEAGRIKYHLKHNLWRPESTVLFVGYQAEGTLGRRILNGEKKVRIHGEEVVVKAQIREISEFSAHADQRGLLNWLKAFDVKLPRQVFLVHGEDEAMAALEDRIVKEIGLPVIIPEMGSEYDLEKIKPEVIRRVVTVSDQKAMEIAVNEAFETIKNKVVNISRERGQDRKVLEKLLAKVNEIEADLATIANNHNGKNGQNGQGRQNHSGGSSHDMTTSGQSAQNPYNNQGNFSHHENRKYRNPKNHH